MAENNSILHELYVFSEWKPEPEYLQKPDNILPENISSLWRWLKFFGPKKSLIDSVAAHKERQQKWCIALGDEGKVIAVLTDNILEIRTKRSEYAIIAARTTVARDAYTQWRKLVWSPDCSFIVVAYGNGVVSFFDLTASSLFNIPVDCSRPGGLECTDNTHAVSEIIFIPLRVKDTKWNWEVLVLTYDGKLRGYLVSQTDGFKLHHTFQFPGGVSVACYSEPHSTLYIAGVPRTPYKCVDMLVRLLSRMNVFGRGLRNAEGENILRTCIASDLAVDPSSPVSAGITAWRVLNDEPFYKLSVVSDELEAQLANKRFHLYIPLIFTKNMNFIIEMAVSPDNSKLVCIHCNGDISIWRLPILKGEYRFKLTEQPEHDMQNPLNPERSKEQSLCYPAGVNWWSNEDVILSRFSGAVSVCRVKDLVNILGKKPEFFQGTPQVTSAYDGTFMTLECESNVLPARKSASDQSMEVVEADADIEDSMLDITKELFKSILYAITDIETFQPKPKKITIVSRIYRLLGVKSTTPTELFSRKIESGSYKEALSLAERFELDSDLVYQQQWRKNPVSSDAIENYLSKVSKKIWAVHQCVDRLPESLPAAKELLSFGLQLTNEKILDEIYGNLPQDEWKDPEDITMENLNAYTSELLRCRHVMIFYKERLGLYEAILHCEKSTYVKDEYHRLRSNSIVHSAMEIAKEGRIEALTCLWPYIKSLTLQLAVLDKLPETLYPLDYQHLLPTKEPVKWFEKKSPIKIKSSEYEHDWCRKEIFRSIWSSNWSEDAPLEPLAGGDEDEGGDEAAGGDICAGEGGAAGGDGADGTTDPDTQLAQWYTHRARQIEERSGLVSHALTLVMIAAAGGAVPGLEPVVCLLETLDMLLYDVNVEDVTLSELEKMSNLEVCKLLMKMSTHATFVSDLKKYVIPFLKRHEDLTKRMGTCLSGLIDFLENISIEDLSYILLVLQSPKEFELDVRTHLELVERCLFAHSGTDQLDMACDLLATILKETDGSISTQSLVRRAGALERAVAGSGRLAWRGVRVPPCALRRLAHDAAHAHMLLTRVARSLATGEQKPTHQDWEHLLKDMLELRATLFDCITEEKCYEMYVSSLLTSGDAPSIRLAADVLSISADIRPMQNGHYRVDYVRSVELVSNAAKEYFNSASSLTDPALELARCCLLLIQDNNIEIEKELDLIAALPILSAFNVSMLPIQVRLCEDKMHLIEECLIAEPNAYLASHKLLKLAKLLRIAGNDEQTREGMILTCVVERALSAGAAGGMAAASAAHRLAALRHAPAAALLARVAAHAHSHADTAERRALLAAAAALAPAHMLGDVLKARLQLELESMQEMGVALRETDKKVERWPSTEEEFADAITTPVIEKKDLISSETPIPILNYLLDTFQNKFSLSEKSKASGGGGDSGGRERAVHCQEFYRSLYSHAQAAGGVGGDSGGAYEQFSAADAPGAAGAAPHRLLHCFYAAACSDGAAGGLEDQVIKKCSEDLVYKDTALSVAVLLRGPAGAAAGEARVGLAVALYAALLRCNATVLRDHAYLAEPRNMAYLTLKQNNASEDQMAVIRHYLDKLNGMGEVDKLRRLGLSVNSLLFNADRDYRTEVIYRLARTGGSEQARISCALAEKYELDVVDVWLQYAAVSLPTVELHTIPAAAYVEEAYKPIRDALWPSIRGNDYPSLISFFTILKKIDDKIQMHGLNVGEHLRLLKKAKAASPDLDYKMIVERAPSTHFSAHVLSVMRADNAGMVCKLLRTLPPAVAPPADAHRLYIKWLTGYFFSVAATGATKRWMQRWRQCVGFFTKLSKDEIMEFVAAVCFSREALERVPSGTRNLIILQAMDYCQQEQGNDFKFSKNEQTWGQMGQELGRWGRFLENYHSSSVQAILEASDVPKDVWFELEMSHGALEGVTRALARAVAGGVRTAALASLLQCLRVPADAHHVLQRAADDAVTVEDIEVLVTRIAQYHKDGVKLSEEYLETVMQKATELGLPPHKQLGLLSLSQRARVQDGEDLVKVAQFTVDLFKTEWPESAYALELTEGKIVDPQGRREALRMMAPLADTWQRRKALAEALACWPPTHGEDGRSLHCEYLQHVLAQDGQPADNLVLVKMLVRRPILTEQEVKLLAETTRNDIVNTMWVILLNPCDSSHEILRNLLNKYKELVQKLRIEDELIKEILDQGMFIKLVSSPIYSNIVYYILNSKDQEHIIYTAHWAIAELIKANYLAEAGHLQLLALGTTTSLLGFSESVLYCLDMMK